jgi:hypothetical protein
MKKEIKKHARMPGLAAILLVGILVSMHQSGYLPQRQTGTPPQGTVGAAGGAAGGPCIFATVSFLSSSGFVTIVHPTSGTIEFVLLPDSIGQIAVSYSSPWGLAIWMFAGSIPAWKVDLSTGSLGEGSGLNVTQSSLTLVSIHQVIIRYTITSGGVDGLYVLGLPSTIVSTIVNVGTQPYTGPLTWLNGKIFM